MPPCFPPQGLTRPGHQAEAINLDPAPHVLPLLLLPQESNGWGRFLLWQSVSLLVILTFPKERTIISDIAGVY